MREWLHLKWQWSHPITFRSSARRAVVIACSAVGAFPGLMSCASQSGGDAARATGAGGTTGSGTGVGGRMGTPTGGTTNTGVPIPIASGGTTAPVSRVCGNGQLTADEACDDGNQVDGDGCSANCRTVESGFTCPNAGKPCQRVARCGDGAVTQPEPCDDGNQANGDGCNSTCRLEAGYKCSGSPSTCSPTTCGDGVAEGTEGCDDGNVFPFDGCGSRCDAEPDCSQGACRSRCGDGMVLGEACDDGNNVSGDGCSSDCTVESGFKCTELHSDCERLNDKCVVRTDVIYRDFTGETTGEHPDFIGCSVLPVTTGLVEARLDTEGKPVLVGSGSTTACITSPTTFKEWYRKAASNVEVAGLVTLFDNGNGGFVNRYGKNGEPWVDAAGKAYDGNPLFFPLDGKGKQDPAYTPKDEPAEACINGKYGKAPASYGAANHNFHFTSEVTHWFKYDANGTATLAFTGDDDVWVFLNGTLAVDLGGVHHPADGSVTIGSATAAQYGLEDGKVYAIKVFQAERRICGSTFRLTLSGFSTARSDCQATCGDGIVALGEECDDGANDGGYNECGPGCRRGEYCGDGIIQAGHEDCDDGNANDGDGCGSACRDLNILL